MPTVDIEQVVTSSLQTPKYQRGGVFNLHWYGRQADECPAWWEPQRDIFLGQFWPSENFLSGAIYSVASRNASFRYTLEGPERQVKNCQEITATADLGRGWHSLVTKLTIDLLTQDNGAFIEVIRPAKAVVGANAKGRKGRGFTGKLDAYNGQYLDAVRIGMKDGHTHWAVVLPGSYETYPLDGLSYTVKDMPTDAPLGIAHLDAQKCQRTGDSMYPIAYSDPQGKLHKLAYWQVISLEDMPSPRAEMNGVGYCAVTRVLRSAQVLRDISIYRHEKISGRFAGSIYLTNMDDSQINDAVEAQQLNAASQGFRRYVAPLVISTLDPNAQPHVERIDLASLPDNFNEDLTLKWYIASLALGLGVDYGFLAPLPGNGLGTSAQTDTQERQARGKSSRLFMQMMAYKFNYMGVFPKTVQFEFKEPDSQEVAERDAGRGARATTRKTQIESGEITPQIARQIAEDDGDLDHRYLAVMGEGDLTPEVTRQGGDNPELEQDASEDVQQTAQSVLQQATDPKMPQPAPQFQPGKEPPIVRAAANAQADDLRSRAAMARHQEQVVATTGSGSPLGQGIAQGLEKATGKAPAVSATAGAASVTNSLLAGALEDKNTVQPKKAQGKKAAPPKTSTDLEVSKQATASLGAWTPEMLADLGQKLGAAIGKLITSGQLTPDSVDALMAGGFKLPQDQEQNTEGDRGQGQDQGKDGSPASPEVERAQMQQELDKLRHELVTTKLERERDDLKREIEQVRNELAALSDEAKPQPEKDTEKKPEKKPEKKVEA